MVRIVCISDTHGSHWDLDVPDGDILVHAGDIGILDSFIQVTDFNEWLATLSHDHILVTPGNHDFFAEKNPHLTQAIITNATILIDQATTIEGLKFYMSPYSPWFFDWAFNLNRGEELQREWAKIPDDTDVLVTHGPPFGILDVTDKGWHVGCEDLLARVEEIEPKLHIFGHLHECSGCYKLGKTIFVNASMCDLHNHPKDNKIITIDL